MKEGVSNQLSLTSTPIKIIANDENAKLPKAIQSVKYHFYFKNN